jgi:hypothetical protein
MTIDATLRKLFQRPPGRLFTRALGEKIVVKRILPTDLITVQNLHPDLLFEIEDGQLIHPELHGYSMAGFACRNLLYFGLILRDYHCEFPEEIFQQGKTKAARELLETIFERKFGPMEAGAREKILNAGLETLNRWSRRVFDARTPSDVFV